MRMKQSADVIEHQSSANAKSKLVIFCFSYLLRRSTVQISAETTEIVNDCGHLV